VKIVLIEIEQTFVELKLNALQLFVSDMQFLRQLLKVLKYGKILLINKNKI